VILSFVPVVPEHRRQRKARVTTTTLCQNKPNSLNYCMKRRSNTSNVWTQKIPFPLFKCGPNCTKSCWRLTGITSWPSCKILLWTILLRYDFILMKSNKHSQLKRILKRSVFQLQHSYSKTKLIFMKRRPSQTWHPTIPCHGKACKDDTYREYGLSALDTWISCASCFVHSRPSWCKHSEFLP